MKLLLITFSLAILILHVLNTYVGLQSQASMVVIIIAILILHGMSRRASRDPALYLRGAREVSPADAPWLFRIVQDLASRHQMEPPRVYVLSGKSKAVHVTGRNTEQPAVIVPEELYQTQAETALRQLMASELSRNKKRPRIAEALIAATAGAIIIYGIANRLN